MTELLPYSFSTSRTIGNEINRVLANGGYGGHNAPSAISSESLLWAGRRSYPGHQAPDSPPFRNEPVIGQSGPSTDLAGAG